MVAAASAKGMFIPLPGLSFALDIHLLINELNLYKSQLGLPEENSDEFRRMAPENQEKVRKYCMTSAGEFTHLVEKILFTLSNVTFETVIQCIPILGGVACGSISFRRNYHFLHQCLNELEGIALDCLDELTTIAVEDMDLD
jgi:hypothetical protein